MYISLIEYINIRGMREPENIDIGIINVQFSNDCVSYFSSC